MSDEPSTPPKTNDSSVRTRSKLKKELSETDPETYETCHDDIPDSEEPTIFETTKEYLNQNIIPYVKPVVVNAWQVSAVYIFWIVLHYVTAHAYVQYCANPSVSGFFTFPFIVSAPHCIAMRWIFTKGGTLIEGMWILIGTWLCSKLVTTSNSS
tara:strand:+ start:1527 stop:1988 length:462 start_codon:yes stop_codon:yes gene_type:complete